ncbi:hypothetical protein CVT26_009775, partial [Gymnopilus dilepis]
EIVAPSDPTFNFETSLFQGIIDAASAESTTSPFGSALTSLATSRATSRHSSPLPSLTPSPPPSRSASTPPPAPRASASNNAPAEDLPSVDSSATVKARTGDASRKQKLKRRNKDKSKGHRKKARLHSSEYTPVDQRAAAHLGSATIAATTFRSENIPIVKTGWLTRRTKGSKTVYSLKDVIGHGAKVKNMKLREWNGRTTLVIVDDKQRIIAICLGAPKHDETWEDVHRRAAEILESARDRLYFEEKDKKHRRGKFPALAVGISHGGGQKYPKWAPRLYAYENDCLSKIIAHDQELRRTNTHPNPEEKELHRNWPKTPWAAATFNFGPQTICYKHIDYNNLAFGWCSITALGNYDPTQGGHLILWELGLVIEFPPGSTILIPSAAISHSNVRVRSNERRYSFTQYSAGGIFRYVNNGFKTVDRFMAGLDDNERGAALDEMSRQLEIGLALYSDVAELKARYSTLNL